MTLGFLYYFLLLVMLLFGSYRSFGPNGDRWYFGGSLIWLALLFIIGLKLFGSPLKG